MGKWGYIHPSDRCTFVRGDMAYQEHAVVDKLNELEADLSEAYREITRLRTAENSSAQALDIIRQDLGLDLIGGEHPSELRDRIRDAIGGDC